MSRYMLHRGHDRTERVDVDLPWIGRQLASSMVWLGDWLQRGDLLVLNREVEGERVGERGKGECGNWNLKRASGSQTDKNS